MEPLGLGHAVWCARNWIGEGESFAVLLADDLVKSDIPCLKQMIDSYKGGNMAAVMDVPRDKTASYGILDVENDDGKIVQAKGVVEKPKPEDAPSTISIIGRYILDSSIFSVLDKQKKGAGGEIQLTDAMNEMIGNVTFSGLRFEGERFDCGERVGFVEANLAFALTREDIRERLLATVKKYL